MHGGQGWKAGGQGGAEENKEGGRPGLGAERGWDPGGGGWSPQAERTLWPWQQDNCMFSVQTSKLLISPGGTAAAGPVISTTASSSVLKDQNGTLTKKQEDKQGQCLSVYSTEQSKFNGQGFPFNSRGRRP